MYSTLEVIAALKEKREKLYLNREMNLIKITKCEQLIKYYCTLYNKTLKSINEKRDTLDLYDGFLNIKEKLQSPKILETISQIFIDEKRENLLDRIDDLTTKGEDLKENVVFYQKKKFHLENENVEIEEKIISINESINMGENTNKKRYTKKM